MYAGMPCVHCACMHAIPRQTARYCQFLTQKLHTANTMSSGPLTRRALTQKRRCHQQKHPARAPPPTRPPPPPPRKNSQRLPRVCRHQKSWREICKICRFLHTCTGNIFIRLKLLQHEANVSLSVAPPPPLLPPLAHAGRVVGLAGEGGGGGGLVGGSEGG